MDLNYIKLEKLGSGSYGTVYKGQETNTGRLVAMKRIHMDISENGFPQSYLREVSLLKDLCHENIVRLEDVHWRNDVCVYLVFEYMMCNLGTYITKYEPNGIRLSALRSYVYQIANALKFCHQRAVLHRDLKPENILIDKYGVVKISDFGLSRTISVPVRAYSGTVVTLWYRAPELMLGDRYSCPLDIWSLGCVFAEMSSGSPLFPGDSDIDQLRKIFSILGTPSEDNWPGVTNLCLYSNFFPKTFHIKETCLHKKCLVRGSGFDLLRKMLFYNPTKRISAKKILNHPYFNGFDNKKRFPPLTNQITSSTNGSLPNLV